MVVSYIEEKDMVELVKKLYVFGVDVFYMVDFFGNLMFDGVRKRVVVVFDQVDCLVGFYGYNNFGLVFINVFEVMDVGVIFIDILLCGMV